ncbi:hypothetical protein EC844_1304 [Acinetobacter calcoaceticus]|uniref:Uncharacterized protein n=1 Tax=Acinetobacter calcoaceticus TaxID=471 RepID=A0A4R1XBC9_ACICA|nr:hypothetical protein EC844_1304 [Acinetobacter calcoaceticus]
MMRSLVYVIPNKMVLTRMNKIILISLGVITVFLSVISLLFFSGMGCMSSTGSSSGCNNPIKTLFEFELIPFVHLPFLFGVVLIYFGRKINPANNADEKF